MMTIEQYTAFLKEEEAKQKKADEKMYRMRSNFESMSVKQQKQYQKNLESNADVHDALSCDLLNEYQ